MCKSSSSVFNRTSPSLLHTFVVDTLLNFPMPFNIIITYANTLRVNDIRRLLVRSSSSLLLVHGKALSCKFFGTTSITDIFCDIALLSGWDVQIEGFLPVQCVGGKGSGL